jgi:hypothetical protein
MKIKSKFKSPITKEKKGITKRTNIQTAIPHKTLSIILNIILKQIANKIIKKIANFQISKFLFQFLTIQMQIHNSYSILIKSLGGIYEQKILSARRC